MKLIHKIECSETQTSKETSNVVRIRQQQQQQQQRQRQRYIRRVAHDSQYSHAPHVSHDSRLLRRFEV